MEANSTPRPQEALHNSSVSRNATQERSLDGLDQRPCEAEISHSSGGSLGQEASVKLQLTVDAWLSPATISQYLPNQQKYTVDP